MTSYTHYPKLLLFKYNLKFAFQKIIVIFIAKNANF